MKVYNPYRPRRSLQAPGVNFTFFYETLVKASFKPLSRLIESLTKLNGRKDLVQTSIVGRVGVCEAIRTVRVKVLKVEATHSKRKLQALLLVIIKYRGIKPKARLKADRYLVNVTFNQDELKLSIGFIKGLMRTDPDELAYMMVGSLTSP